MRLVVDGVEVEVEVRPGGVTVVVGGERVEVPCARDGDGTLRVAGQRAWVDGGLAGVGLAAARVRRVASRAADGGAGALTPPIPSTVLRVLVAPGDTVTAAQPLLVLGAMKTELVVRAPHAGRVKQVFVRPGQAVSPGERLVEVDPGTETL